MYFYKNVHGGGYQPTTTPLEIDSKRENSIFVTPTEVLNNPDVEFIVARKLPSSRSIFSTAAHGGPHYANISSLLQRISHSRDPPLLTRSLPPLSPFLFLLLDPGEASAGAGSAPRRKTRRRRWGALRPQASGAAACSEDLHRCRVMPAAADVPLIPRLLREHTCLTSLGITTGNKR